MSVTVGWSVIHADGCFEGLKATLRTAVDVAAWVERFADPLADSARLVHNARPLWIPEQNWPDHEMYAAVVDGYGYLAYQDRYQSTVYSVGAPESPGFESDDAGYPPGSGLSLHWFETAVAEWLRTAELPTVVEWRNNTG
ncbi:hypothetical protein KZQ38_09105 [Saccharothrix sp. SC076]|nr:hypothetical protein [Saccharothrix obliqua]